MALAAQSKSRLQRHRRLAQHFPQRMQVVENEVHQALAVLDKATGKMLNYRQLIQHPTYKKDWQLSSANEFGRLVNVVGGRVKGTNYYNQVHSYPRCQESTNERCHIRKISVSRAT
jgi:hypothetical protein